MRLKIALWVVFACAVCGPVGVCAQVVWQQALPVVVGTDTLQLAWAGGLNAPQFSQVDLAGTGRADLLLYEVAGGVYLPIRQQAPERWQWAPEAAGLFPRTQVYNWVQLADADGDGRRDFFADTLSGVRIWRDTATTGPPAYAPWVPQLQTRVLGAVTTDTLTQVLYNSNTDPPGLADVDADGDLDVLAYDIFGSVVSYHRNFAQEALGRTDTLVLYRASECWGHFREAYDPQANTFTAELGFLDCTPREFTSLHAGGFLLPLQLNGDTLTDLLISDAGVPSVVALINGGTRGIADMVQALPDYPAVAPIDLPEYPGVYSIEATGDGIPDLLASNQSPFNTGANAASVWRYRNVGTAGTPAWALAETDFLQQEMLDVGANAALAFGDLSGDGVPDLLLASGGERRGAAPLRIYLQYYRNTGSLADPSWVLEEGNYLQLDAAPILQNATELMPALADVDGDGDTDLVLGYYRPAGDHRLLFYRNEAPPGQAAQFALVNSDLGNVGAQNLVAPAPTFADPDQDGDADILLGDALGRLHWVENRGNPSTPDYRYREGQWGGVQVTTPVGTAPFAKPLLLELDGDPTPELLVGAVDGRLYQYDDISTAQGAVFTPAGTAFGLSVGRRAAPAILPLGTDSLRLFVGTGRGGVQYTTVPGSQVRATRQGEGPLFRLYPNPAREVVTLVGPAGTHIEVWNLLGQQVATAVLAEQNGAGTPLSLAGYREGVYLVRFRHGAASETFRLVVTSNR